MKVYRFCIISICSFFVTASLFSQKNIGITYESSLVFKYPFAVSIYYDKPLYKRNQRFILSTYQDRWKQKSTDYIPLFHEFTNEWRIGLAYAVNMISNKYRLMCFLTLGVDYVDYHSQYLYSDRKTMATESKTVKIKSIHFTNGINFGYRIPLRERFEIILGCCVDVSFAELGDQIVVFENKLVQKSSRDGFWFELESALKIGCQYRIN